MLPSKKLQDRGRANDLNAFWNVASSQRVTNRAFCRGQMRYECVRNFVKERGRNAANLFHHFGV
jgi:hypothetical protein